MIAYNKYTLQQLIDEVILRLGSHRSAENLDWYTIALYVNQGLEQTMMHTTPLKEWAYTTSIEIAHLDVLDLNFIAPIRVMLSETGAPPFHEARHIDVREWFTIQDSMQRQRWNRSTFDNPTYMIWGRTLYLHPSATWDPSIAVTMSGFMDCFQIPPRVLVPTGVLLIPYEFEELIILLALERIVARTMDNEILGQITQSVEAEKAKVLDQYTKRRHVKKRNLESFVEAVSPLVPPVPEAGELAKRLI